jgi:uncharacterized integral membrane protein
MKKIFILISILFSIFISFGSEKSCGWNFHTPASFAQSMLGKNLDERLKFVENTEGQALLKQIIQSDFADTVKQEDMTRRITLSAYYASRTNQSFSYVYDNIDIFNKEYFSEELDINAAYDRLKELLTQPDIAQSMLGETIYDRLQFLPKNKRGNIQNAMFGFSQKDEEYMIKKITLSQYYSKIFKQKFSYVFDNLDTFNKEYFGVELDVNAAYTKLKNILNPEHMLKQKQIEKQNITATYSMSIVIALLLILFFVLIKKIKKSVTITILTWTIFYISTVFAFFAPHLTSIAEATNYISFLM